MGTGIDPKVDYAFKRIFGSEENRDVLTGLLNAIFAGSVMGPIREVELLNPFSFKDAIDDRLSILDIKARDDQQRESLVEMQNLAHADYRGRLVYYGARHFSQMLGEGDDYSQLKPVIVVCILNDVLFEESVPFHSCFELIDARSGLRFSEHLTIHVLELPKFDKTLNDLVDELDRWVYFLKYGEDLDPDHLPSQLQTFEIRKATGVLDMLSHDTSERALYDASQMQQRDEASRIKTALNKGRLDGLTEGRVEGRLEGRTQGVRASLLRLGTRLFGEPSSQVVDQLQAITNPEQLEQLTERLMDVSGWSELLNQTTSTRTS